MGQRVTHLRVVFGDARECDLGPEPHRSRHLVVDVAFYDAF